MESSQTRIMDVTLLNGLLLLNFGNEIGTSLAELEEEYDHMISTFGTEKFEKDYTSLNTRIMCKEDDRLNHSIARTNEESCKRSGLNRTFSSKDVQSSFDCVNNTNVTVKRKLSHRGSCMSRPNPLNEQETPGNNAFRAHLLTKFSCLHASTPQLLHNCNDDDKKTVFENLSNHSKSWDRLYCTLPTKLKAKKAASSLNLSETKNPQRPRQIKDHVLIPPVLINGEIKSNYQYLSPKRKAVVKTINHREKKLRLPFRANELAKIIGKTGTFSPPKVQKQEKSSLKALYNATVLIAEQSNTENSTSSKHRGYSTLPARSKQKLFCA